MMPRRTFAAPEMLETLDRRMNSKAVDIWGIGATLVYLVSGQTIFRDFEDINLIGTNLVTAHATNIKILNEDSAYESYSGWLLRLETDLPNNEKVAELRKIDKRIADLLEKML